MYISPFNKIWPLEGYLLKERLYQHQKLAERQAVEAAAAEDVGLEGNQAGDAAATE